MKDNRSVSQMVSLCNEHPNDFLQLIYFHLSQDEKAKDILLESSVFTKMCIPWSHWPLLSSCLARLPLLGPHSLVSAPSILLLASRLDFLAP